MVVPDPSPRWVGKSALVFPYLYGPATRRFGTALLWHGRLCCSQGSFLSPYPIRHFSVVWPAARGTRLEQVFAAVAHFALLGDKEGLKEDDNLGVLGDSISRVAIVGPGTSNAYGEWEPYHAPCLGQAASMLEDTQVVTVAANEFVWRVYELSLEMGAEAEKPLSDPKPLVQRLAKRAAQLGSPEALLAECLLNRHRVLIPEAMPIVTDQAAVVGIYASIGKMLLGESDNPEAYNQGLSFMLFDALIGGRIPPLEHPHTKRIAKILRTRAEALKAARTKCEEEAMRLVNENPAADRLRDAVEISLRKLHEEVSAILEIDRTAFNNLVRSATENDMLWVTLATAAGGLLGGLPDFASAVGAITAFSILGTSALKESRLRRDVLRKSPWAFLYFLRHR